MAAPAHVQSSAGVVDTAGAYTDGLTGVTVGNFIIAHVNADGDTDGLSQTLGSCTGIEALDGTAGSMTKIGAFPIAPGAVSHQHIWIGRATATTVAFNATTRGEDVYLQVYEVTSEGNVGTTLAEVIENGTAGNAANDTSNGTTSFFYKDCSVETLGPDRLALNLQGIADDNAMGSFVGETGGDWTLVSQFASATGTDAAVALQVATMPTAGTIGGGEFEALASDGRGVVGFAIIPGEAGGGEQTLTLGKVASGEAVRGVTLAQDGPDTLSLGHVPSGEAVRGLGLTQAGPATLSLGKVASGEAVRGLGLSQSGPQTLSLGKVASGEAVRGIDLAGATLTLSLGKVASGEAVRGIGLAQSGPAALSLGKVPSGEAVRGITLGGAVQELSLGKVASGATVRGIGLSQSGPVSLTLGKVASGATVRGVDMAQSGPVALALGKVATGETVRGLGLTQVGPTTLALGKVPTGATVRGLGLAQSGPVALSLGKVASGALVRGILIEQGFATIVALALAATARYGLELNAQAAHELSLTASVAEARHELSLSAASAELTLAATPAFNLSLGAVIQ